MEIETLALAYICGTVATMWAIRGLNDRTIDDFILSCGWPIVWLIALDNLLW